MTRAASLSLMKNGTSGSEGYLSVWLYLGGIISMSLGDKLNNAVAHYECPPLNKSPRGVKNADSCVDPCELIM